MYDELKVRNTVTAVLDIPRSIAAAAAAFRDDFRHILGSEPIVENLGNDAYRIATYGGGEYQIIGQFSMRELPGCCGVAVFYHASVTSRYSGRGLGKLFLAIREKAAILAGYSIAQATVLKSNDAERHILEAAGWNRIWEFKNNRTKNMVRVYIKSLV